MSEYYLHDAENGRPQQAAQIWRDSHTEDQLAEKIRAHLMRYRHPDFQLMTVYTTSILTLQE